MSFPVLPEIYIDEVSRQHLRKRNPRLFTPRDFDYSPYFEVMKFPVLRLDETAAYRKLSWDNAEDAYHYAEDDFVAIGMEAYLPPRCR